MSTISVNIDQEIKRQSEALFKKLGLNMSTAINIFLRQAIRSSGLPFEVVSDEIKEPGIFDVQHPYYRAEYVQNLIDRGDPDFSGENLKRFENLVAEFEEEKKAGRLITHELIEVEDD